MYKRKIGFNKTALRLDGIKPGDDVVLGVLDAAKQLKGFPEIVTKFTIHEGVKIRKVRNEVRIGLGVCQRNGRTSEIEMWAGSIRKAIAEGRHIDPRSYAKETALHELDHANYNQEEQDGFWFDVELSDSDKEIRAENFARENFINKF